MMQLKWANRSTGVVAAGLLVGSLWAQPPGPGDVITITKAGPAGPMGGPDGAGQPRRLVKQFDKDGDGKLNKEERQAAREFLKNNRRPAAGRRRSPDRRSHRPKSRTIPTPRFTTRPFSAPCSSISRVPIGKPKWRSFTTPTWNCPRRSPSMARNTRMSASTSAACRRSAASARAQALDGHFARPHRQEATALRVQDAQPAQLAGFALPLPNGHDFPDFNDCATNTVEPMADWVAVVHRGGPVRALDRHMPAFGDALTTRRIERVVQYLWSFCPDPAWPRGELNLPRAFFLTREGLSGERDGIDDGRDHIGTGARHESIGLRAPHRRAQPIRNCCAHRRSAGRSGGPWNGGLGDAFHT